MCLFTGPMLGRDHSQPGAVLPLLPKFRNFQEILGFSRKEKAHFENKIFQELIVASYTIDIEDWNILYNFRIFCEIPGIFRVYFRISNFGKWKH